MTDEVNDLNLLLGALHMALYSRSGKADVIVDGGASLAFTAFNP
jgi:hypothetical protein